MSEKPWARHYQETWLQRASDPSLPYWLRVACLAYGSHENNGHAQFKRGAVALILATVDRTTGEVKPYAHVGRAIREAIEGGWLEPESYWRCLVVPAHAIKKGPHGTASQCPIHVARRRPRRANPPLSGGFEGDSSTPSGGFAARSRHSVAGSEREPLSSLLPLVGRQPDPDASPAHPEAI